MDQESNDKITKLLETINWEQPTSSPPVTAEPVPKPNGFTNYEKVALVFQGIQFVSVLYGANRPLTKQEIRQQMEDRIERKRNEYFSCVARAKGAERNWTDYVTSTRPSLESCYEIEQKYQVMKQVYDDTK